MSKLLNDEDVGPVMMMAIGVVLLAVVAVFGPFTPATMAVMGLRLVAKAAWLTVVGTVRR